MTNKHRFFFGTRDHISLSIAQIYNGRQEQIQLIEHLVTLDDSSYQLPAGLFWDFQLLLIRVHLLQSHCTRGLQYPEQSEMRLTGSESRVRAVTGALRRASSKEIRVGATSTPFSRDNIFVV